MGVDDVHVPGHAVLWLLLWVHVHRVPVGPALQGALLPQLTWLTHGLRQYKAAHLGAAGRSGWLIATAPAVLLVGWSCCCPACWLLLSPS